MQNAVVLTFESENETLVVLFMIVVYNGGLNVNKILKTSQSNITATGHCKYCLLSCTR